jgi:SH3 domain (SH3b1 type)/NlpC/P60 family
MATGNAASPGYWLERAAAVDDILMSPARIELFNARLFALTDTLVELREYPDSLDAGRLAAMIASVSRRPGSARCYANGTLLADADFERYEYALNTGAIAGRMPVRFGLCVHRANLRSFPTLDAVFVPGSSVQLDRFQESALFPADVVAVLHESTDGGWLLVQSFNYLAWVRSDAIAIGTRDRVFDYEGRSDFVVVTGDKLIADIDPQSGTGTQLDMGTRLPLTVPASDHHESEHTAAPYRVDLPIRAADGSLQLKAITLARQQDVHRGYLPFTRRKLIGQAFKFLGERYGWGHSGNTRDCSGFIAEVHRTFGICLPRNADDQASCRVGRNLLFGEHDSLPARLNALESLQTGDLVFTPGHVMLYLGTRDGEPYVIHDASALNHPTPDGQLLHDAADGVAVSPLRHLCNADGTRHVDVITCIKRIWDD